MMDSLWFLKLALKCVDLLSWPLLALGYPLCASIQAIERDSHSDTQNLISYWILLSLIYLFEYAFLKLLQWFQFWPYMKLMIIAWLVIPDFERANYVYNHLVRSCISVNPQAIISRFRNWKKIFVKQENFVMHAEKYITENGTGALEKLIASKNTAQNLYAETIKVVPATKKNEMQQTNKVRLHMEQKDIKDLEMIEREEVPKGKQSSTLQANTALCSLKSNENKSTAMVETKVAAKGTARGESPQSSASKKYVSTVSCSLKSNEDKSTAMAETRGVAVKDTARGDSPQSSASKNVQKEWTCAMCQVTTTSETTLNSHLHGRKHKAACEALKVKNQSVPVKAVTKKSDRSNEEPEKIMDTANALKQKSTTNHHRNKEKKNVQISNVQQCVKPKMGHEKSIVTDVLNQRTTKDQENKSKGVHANTKVQELQKSVGTTIGMKNSILRCDICNVKCTSEVDMASHLKGRKHLAQIESLTGS